MRDNDCCLASAGRGPGEDEPSALDDQVAHGRGEEEPSAPPSAPQGLPWPLLGLSTAPGAVPRVLPQEIVPACILDTLQGSDETHPILLWYRILALQNILGAISSFCTSNLALFEPDEISWVEILQNPCSFRGSPCRPNLERTQAATAGTAVRD